MESANLRPGPSDQFRIRRKPVSNPNLRGTANADHQLSHATSSPALVPPSLLRPPSYTELYGPAPQSPQLPQPDSLHRPRTAGATTSTSTTPPPPPPSSVQKAYGEARHFLGGLINHPTESNKHFTILRHSHGLVFYRGNTTSVAVSIFSDAPLPFDRTIWLQSKGWSGNTGMRTKALLRLNNSWLDVTPGMPIRADQVKPDDERAWQRDIKKFRKKAPARPRDTHKLRETTVVRIPAEAGDGYFQLVLCQGLKKKVLCYSPVFRVLSTSANPHSLRGASLSTLPLEVGAMVVSLYAQTAARTVATPAAAVVTAKVNPYRPSWVTQTAVQKVYSASGVQDRVGGVLNPSVGSSQRSAIGQEPPPFTGTEVSPVHEGPQLPFPMIFKARGELAHTPSPNSLNETPKMALTKVPDWVPEQLRGYFFGWARFCTNLTKDAAPGPWCPIVFSIRTLDPLQVSRVDMAQIARRTVTLRLLDEVPIQTTQLDIRLMGFLRDDIPPPTGSSSQELADAQAAAAEAALLADVYDVSVVQNTLAHPAWAPEVPSAAEIQRQNTSWADKTREGYATARARGLKWVEQVPLHRLGVRSATDEWRERQVAVNGFYIVR
ncbi:hypothetical protein N7448_001936 [Penicillium atrosanguineum]|uniref:LipA and NB-ARC domain protein n=1 Tax=Penicillium atrosanguineum TaxID=1132637 RepID=A0A9W9HDG0_9EURO|nr:acetyl-CoA synthetase-like protein [Penicillium atrosanguineum]KAJ5128218.1 hypothetical protein N7526_006384 [Penicillium atrosanguineum]KAJ5144544.1 hypothetical protein N7448_001936 [Penicillium atrosanguineum]KAJ5300335.1 acetyl-CoA synthetase-like protein [Penicillium atrosanguineum]KAJ5310975.1 hypothetical protein N7476_006835 [Penicillium atrosanguineum]